MDEKLFKRGQFLSCAESGLLIEVGIFSPSNVAFLSSLWTK